MESYTPSSHTIDLYRLLSPHLQQVYALHLTPTSHGHLLSKNSTKDRILTSLFIGPRRIRNVLQVDRLETRAAAVYPPLGTAGDGLQGGPSMSKGNLGASRALAAFERLASFTRCCHISCNLPFQLLIFYFYISKCYD